MFYVFDWHKTCLDIKHFLKVREHWTLFMVSALPLHPRLTTTPQPSRAPGVGADAVMDTSKGRRCLPLPAKWKPAVPTPSALIFGSSRKNVNIQRSCSGLQAIFKGDAETLLKQTGSFRSFSADFCPHELQFNHGKCQHLLFLVDFKSTHSSKGKRSALLAWAIKDKKMR